MHLNLNTEGILATGAELVNCFCIGKGKQAILSQHIGDLKNLETMNFYTEAIERFSRLFRVNPIGSRVESRMAILPTEPSCHKSSHFVRGVVTKSSRYNKKVDPQVKGIECVLPGS